ncbi:L,D-transpeptidase [Labedaea rhizosphaerae]|uniref:Lipoprotein-anchoring transpeptidase ErfK/SrfK n=1 Tax=Labedaea rhizosphaerae TaxID=598644 RepID=A0A4R6SJF2_LABRH|nr:L,D-transpeptidase [Labedaea rhizosphaerae]TDQ04188.1 lipoprotein-anchoring transpeptidase ErfK/SrfK [Labedaea rhizosphaerae]
MRGKWGLGGSAAAVLMAVVLSACGTGDAAPQAGPTTTATTTTTSDTTTTPTTTTTTAAPTTTTTTKKPTTTRKTTTTRPTTTHRRTTTTHSPTPQRITGVPCSAAASACVDLSANRAWLLGNGHVILGPVSITSGRAGYRTPTGTFHVQWKDIDHLSKEFDNAPMPYSVFFNSGIAFHTGSLAAESHGCIHLSNSSAKTFYYNLSVGDVVQVVP